MPEDANALSLQTLLEGWDSYQLSLVRAIAPRTRAQLIWRPAPHLRTAGELARHIAAGRVDWFSRTFGTDVAGPAARVSAWRRNDPIEEDAAELVAGLEASWQMIEEALRQWT